MVETISRTFQATGTAGDRDSAVLTKWAAAQFRQMFQIDVHIVRDIQVEVAIIVVIAKGGAGTPAIGITYASFDGDIGESAIVIIVVEHRIFEIGDVKVFPAIVVVVAHRHSETPAAAREARLNGHISESAVMIVAI